MLNTLKDRNILIAITGGIAAYKILELIRRLQEQQANIKVILTDAGKEFVTPLSLQALLGAKIYQTLLDPDNEVAMSHIELARWAEVLLVAPATANFIAKYTDGKADDLLTTVCLATAAPVLIAPAMNQQMWQHLATQQNINTLQQRAVKILGPAVGGQACGEFGPGRMLEPSELLQELQQFFMPKVLTGKHVVITAGPTVEAIDPIRYISNHSSGKMGYALAQAALDLGASVTLISGPTALTAPRSPSLELINVISAAQMQQSVLDVLTKTKTDIFVGCAAVADYAPKQIQPQKIKKDATTLTLELERTPDILATVAKLPNRPLIIGFAAETENLIANATSKLKSKALDLIVANNVATQQVFNSDFNQVVLINKNQIVTELDAMSKKQVALQIFKNILES